MTRTTMAVAADYADAMLIARRWKNRLVLLLLLSLIIQIAVFLVLRYAGRSQGASTTQPVLNAIHDWSGLAWLINFVDFLSMLCVSVLAVVLLLILGIMLVGRLIGVSYLTGAFIWCVVLASVLFPWQSLWNYPVAGTNQATPSPVENVEVGPRFGLPGALYTWPELMHRSNFPDTPPTAAIMGWARFVGWPIVAIIILFTVQVRSSRGLKLALGEAEVQVVGSDTSGPTGGV